MLRPTNVITDRFGKPAKDLMVDYINAWNRSHIEVDQVRFTDVTALDGQGFTQTLIEFDEHTGWSSGSAPLTYYRYDIRSVFSNQPMVLYTASQDPEDIYAAIYDQYGLLIEQALSQLEPVVVEGEAVTDYDLIVLPDHLIFYGTVRVQTREAIRLLGQTIDSRMDLREFYVDGNRHRPPVELYATKGEFLLDGVEQDLQRLYETDLRRFTSDSSIGEFSPLVSIMRELTGDPWVCAVDEVPFNLYGADFVYNGRVEAQYPISDQRFNYTLVLQLGAACSNLSGLLRIAYRYAEVRPLTNQPSQASVYPIFQR